MKARQPQPFARRIVVAFVLMTALVSGIFSFGIVAVVHVIEKQLVSEEMQRDLNIVLQEDLRNGRPPRLDAQTQFYASNLPEYAIPVRFTALDEGFTEWVDGDQAQFAYVRTINGVRYVLVQEQDDIELREKALFSVVFAGFILAVLGAWVLGRAMARKVMAPLSRLAVQVQHQDQRQPTARPLAPDYPDDEVGQLAQAFDKTIGMVRRSLEREQLFTSDVSHELRTPLMVIATSCELMALSPLTGRQEEQLRRIEHATGEMRALVETFLKLARGNTDERMGAANAELAQVAEQQVAHWSPLIAGKGLRFEFLTEAPDTGRYSAILLATVIANLLRNALHYTDAGHIRLILETGGFRVEDSGMGISEDQHESIFQPFVRGAQTRGEGLGLGLSLVKRICTDQGWSITVHTLSPSGTCFRVRLDAGAISSSF